MNVITESKDRGIVLYYYVCQPRLNLYYSGRAALECIRRNFEITAASIQAKLDCLSLQ